MQLVLWMYQELSEIKNLTNKHFSSDRKLSLWMNAKEGKVKERWSGSQFKTVRSQSSCWSSVCFFHPRFAAFWSPPGWDGPWLSRPSTWRGLWGTYPLFFSWNDALKFEEWIFGKVFQYIWFVLKRNHHARKSKSKFKTLVYGIPPLSNKHNNRRTAAISTFRQNSNGSF